MISAKIEFPVVRPMAQPVLVFRITGKCLGKGIGANCERTGGCISVDGKNMTVTTFYCGNTIKLDEGICMSIEKNELMVVVENLEGKATVKDWATAASKLSALFNSGDASDSVRQMSRELGHKSHALVQMWKAGLADTTPYVAIQNVVHSDWILKSSIEKAGGKSVFTVTLSDYL